MCHSEAQANLLPCRMLPDRREAVRLMIASAKDAPCCDCGQRYPAPVMEFDHVPERGPKAFGISRARTGAVTVEAARAELAKCDLVCANCHRLRTMQRPRTRATGPRRPTRTSREWQRQWAALVAQR